MRCVLIATQYLLDNLLLLMFRQIILIGKIFTSLHVVQGVNEVQSVWNNGEVRFVSDATLVVDLSIVFNIIIVSRRRRE